MQQSYWFIGDGAGTSMIISVMKESVHMTWGLQRKTENESEEQKAVHKITVSPHQVDRIRVTHSHHSSVIVYLFLWPRHFKSNNHFPQLHQYLENIEAIEDENTIHLLATHYINGKCSLNTLAVLVTLVLLSLKAWYFTTLSCIGVQVSALIILLIYSSSCTLCCGAQS